MEPTKLQVVRVLITKLVKDANHDNEIDRPKDFISSVLWIVFT